MVADQEWESILQIKTAGRDDSRSDAEHHPYEPTDYCVLERLANSGYITKQNTLIDYGSGIPLVLNTMNVCMNGPS